MTDPFREGTRVQVRVPASSGNLGPGFDSFGLALAWYDDVEVVLSGRRGLRVEVSGEGADTISRDESHLVVRAIRATFDRLRSGQPAGLELRCTNRIPHGRGLGSSAAAIVAGVSAARSLVVGGARILDDAAALQLASDLEGHPDNVAACLLGGLTLAWTDVPEVPDVPDAVEGVDIGDTSTAPLTTIAVRAVRLEPMQVTGVLFVPGAQMSTADARGLLPAVVPHPDAAANAARTALLVAALTGAGGDTGGDTAEIDLSLLLSATYDRLHQPYRASAMSGSSALVERLRARGIPAVVSGAGPTVLAFVRAEDASDVAADAPSGFTAHTVAVDREGARTTVGGPAEGAGNGPPPEDVAQGGET
jgi:homoserine kinase